LGKKQEQKTKTCCSSLSVLLSEEMRRISVTAPPPLHASDAKQQAEEKVEVSEL